MILTRTPSKAFEITPVDQISTEDASNSHAKFLERLQTLKDLENTLGLITSEEATQKRADMLKKADYDRLKDNKPFPRVESITEWLKSIGLEKYEADFLRNDITPDILPEITDADLKDMGINSVGARKRILKGAK